MFLNYTQLSATKISIFSSGSEANASEPLGIFEEFFLRPLSVHRIIVSVITSEF